MRCGVGVYKSERENERKTHEVQMSFQALYETINVSYFTYTSKSQAKPEPT